MYMLGLHRVLNARADGALSDAWWLNMGLWTAREGADERIDASTPMAAACSRMAAELAARAAWSADDVVLDVGYGCGDQDLFWWQHARPRPAAIVGVTLDAAQHTIAANRARDAGIDRDVRLHCGSATELDAVLPPNEQRDGFGAVVALDCAYHFNTRRTFLADAFTRLRPGGRVALADLVLGPECDRAHAAWTFRLTSWLGGMPSDNLITREEYVAMLAKLGYEDITVDVVSERVFAGLAVHIGRQVGWWTALTQPHIALALNTMASWLRTTAKSHALDFVLVSARRPAL